MTENNNNFARLNKKPRCKKLQPKIELTAMVSVSFILIAFYMIRVELSKPKIMDLGLPNYCNVDDSIIHCGPRSDRVLTLLLDDNDQIISYQGLLAIPEELPKKLNYGKDGIRKELLNKNKLFTEINSELYSKNKGIIVLIKPSKKSNYGNLVSILDEMSITNIQTYTIINDFTPEEFKLLASN